MLPVNIALIGASIFTAILTIICIILFLPEKIRSKLPKKLQAIGGFFNLEKSYSEVLLKVVYIAGTVFSFLFGLFLTFTKYHTVGYNGKTTTAQPILLGICIMILGPIALRIIFEIITLFIRRSKSTIELNEMLKKLPQLNDDKTDK